MTTAAPSTALPAVPPERRPRLRRPANEPDSVGGLPPQWAVVAIGAGAPPVTTRDVPAAGPVGAVTYGAEPAAGSASTGVRSGDERGPGDMVRPDPASRPAGRARPGEAGGTSAELHRLAADMVRRMVEVLAGRRTPTHLTGVARPQVVRYLTASRDTGRGARRATPPRRVHVSRPAPDAAEVVAICRFGDRFRALTVRLDRTPPDREWQASAVRLL